MDGILAGLVRTVPCEEEAFEQGFEEVEYQRREYSGPEGPGVEASWAHQQRECCQR